MTQLSFFDYGQMEDDSIFQELQNLQVNKEVTFQNQKFTINVMLNDHNIYEYYNDDVDGCSSKIQKVYQILLKYLHLN